jgi:hypothetical protein
MDKLDAFESLLPLRGETAIAAATPAIHRRLIMID